VKAGRALEDDERATVDPCPGKALFISKELRQFAIIAFVCYKTLPISLLSSLA
jgi:hypothetical protein